MPTETPMVEGGLRAGPRRLISRLDAAVCVQWNELHHATAVIGTAIYAGVQPHSWVRTVRKAFARQMQAIGVEPLWFVWAVAVFVGMAVVV